MKRLIISLVLVLSILTFNHQRVSAAQLKGAAFTANIVAPENQKNEKDPFFNLQVTPGQKQTLTIELVNQTSRPLILSVEPSTAITTINGQISYAGTGKTFDQSLKHPFSKMGIKKQKISLNGNEDRKVSFTYTVPKDKFDGSIMGGLLIKQLKSDDTVADERKSDKDTIKIENAFQQTIAVVMNENSKEIKTDLRLQSAHTGMSGQGNAAILANVRNVSPMAFGGLKIEAQVINADNLAVVYKNTAEDLSMAPNSNFDFAIPVGAQSVKAGNYTLKLTASSGVRKWNMNTNFTVTDAQASKLNKQNLTIKHDYTWLWILSIISGIILLAAILILFYYLGGRRAEKQSRTRDE